MAASSRTVPLRHHDRGEDVEDRRHKLSTARRNSNTTDIMMDMDMTKITIIMRGTSKATTTLTNNLTTLEVRHLSNITKTIMSLQRGAGEDDLAQDQILEEVNNILNRGEVECGRLETDLGQGGAWDADLQAVIQIKVSFLFCKILRSLTDRGHRRPSAS